MKRSIAMLASVAAVGVTASLPSAANAAEIGQVCNTAGGYVELAFDNPGHGYYMAQGAGFRIVGFYNGSQGSYYYGHGNGQPNGYYPRSGVYQGTCV